eukprot:s525_g3.t1
MDETEGLEIKVSFHGVWKQSLTELSGGQRSLLALSLVLALLLFKPAPMYILDEIDSALDLSHTQILGRRLLRTMGPRNIGHMIRTHFPHSQFIVVSLKEGMFNHANVLFRTRFIDGTSTVTRYAIRDEDDRVEGDLAVGRGLTTALCAEPVIDVEAVENLCNASLQDALMVVYLSNLTRTQISIAEKISSLFGFVSEIQ